MRRVYPFALLLLVATIESGALAFSQAVPEEALVPTLEQQHAQVTGNGISAQQENTVAKALDIAPGTHVLMALVSPLHSTSGSEGSEIYLEVVVPVVENGQVVIPAHTYVQGKVEGSRRPGHFRRTSAFHFRFTNMIFPNNRVETIDAVLQSIPGSKITRTTADGDLRTVDQTEKILTPMAAGAVAGAVIGSATRFGIGKFTGAGLGAAVGLAGSVLQRGDNIDFPVGTRMEMVLRNSIKLSKEQQEFNARYLAAPVAIPSDPVSVRERQEPIRRDRPRSPGLGWFIPY